MVLNWNMLRIDSKSMELGVWIKLFMRLCQNILGRYWWKGPLLSPCNPPPFFSHTHFFTCLWHIALVVVDPEILSAYTPYFYIGSRPFWDCQIILKGKSGIPNEMNAFHILPFKKRLFFLWCSLWHFCMEKRQEGRYVWGFNLEVKVLHERKVAGKNKRLV